jgi:hypothetical protein
VVLAPGRDPLVGRRSAGPSEVPDVPDGATGPGPVRSGGPAGEAAVVGARSRVAFGRRGLRLALGALWILDGLLQFQPALRTARFAREVVTPAADGQPAWVAWPVHHASSLLAAHPAAGGAACGAVQLLLGVGLLRRRTVRPALVGSIVWAVSVWVVGEGLGGLAGGTSSFLTGAPGAAALYALLAAAAWPDETGATGSATDPVAPWFASAWAGLWVVLGASSLFPAGRSGAGVAGQLRDVAATVPAWLAGIDRGAADLAGAAGLATVLFFGVVPVLIGLGGLATGRSRRWAARAGIGLAVAAWVVGQGMGQLASGTSTDPNTAPLLVLAGLALLGTTTATPTRARRRPVPSSGPARHTRHAIP